MEVLSPVKNFDGAKAAINAGACAIYFSSDKFGARTNAKNSFEEVCKIVEYAKTHYVKTYITLNTIIMNDEIETFIKEVNLLHSVGVDALIVQDVSMIKVIKEMFSDIEIHCSTQMNIGNSLAAKFVKNLGASRVVLPRELNISQIQKIIETGVETEVFVHGALCTSYSGICLISSVLNKNSGNRGRCNQICRMPLEMYKNNIKLETKGNYLLSLRDLNVSDNIHKLKDINVTSIKIEGRLKQVEYVSLTTYTYRKLLETNLDNELYKVYNREFTNGYLFRDSSAKLQNLVRVNNNGYYVGNVYKCGNGYFEIKSDYEISHLDKVRFVKEGFENGQTIDVIETIDKNTYRIKSNYTNLLNCKVYIVSNYSISKRNFDYYSENKKKYEVYIEMTLGKKLKVTYNNKSYYSTNKLEKALKKPVSKENIVKQFSKTKDYPFDFNINLKYCEGFIALKELNEIRREIYNDITNSVLKVEHEDKSYAYEINNREASNTLIYVEVNNELQLEKLSGSNIIIVLTNHELLSYARTLGFSVYYKFSSIIEDEYTFNYSIYIEYDGIIVSEVGALGYFKDLNISIISNATFNTSNVINQSFMLNYVSKTILSHEICYEDLNMFDLENSICYLYGKLDVMTMKYCVINKEKVDTCNGCNLCKRNDYSIKYGNDYYNLMYSNYDKLALLSDKPIYNKGLLNINTSYYIRFSDEVDVLSLLSDILNGKCSNYIDNYKERTK